MPKSLYKKIMYGLSDYTVLEKLRIVQKKNEVHYALLSCILGMRRREVKKFKKIHM